MGAGHTFALSMSGSVQKREDDVYWRDVDFTKYMFYNAVQTFTVDTMFYPLDLVKTRLQVLEHTKEVRTTAFRFNNVT